MMSSVANGNLIMIVDLSVRFPHERKRGKYNFQLYELELELYFHRKKTKKKTKKKHFMFMKKNRKVPYCSGNIVMTS